MIDSQIITSAIHISSLIKHVLKPPQFLVLLVPLRKVQCEDLEIFREGLQLVTFWCPDSGAHLLRSLGAVAQVAASNRSSADPTTCGCARGLTQKVQLLKRIHPYYKASLEHTVSIYVHLCLFMSVYVHLCPFMSIYLHYVCLFV